MLRDWRYTDRISQTRRAALAAPGSFFPSRQTCRSRRYGCKVRAEPGRDPGLTDCFQPIFSFELAHTGDALFTARGATAQYWRSPEHRLAANAEPLAALTPRLLEAVEISLEPDLGKIDVSASLRAASAKIWIRESRVYADPLPPSDLAVERWVAAAARGDRKAPKALLAPETIVFDVKGALIDPDGNEVVPVGRSDATMKSSCWDSRELGDPLRPRIPRQSSAAIAVER